ncbi:Orn/Lys/Arg family decarboxylase [Azospirillum sp. sgz302134]
MTADAQNTLPLDHLVSTMEARLDAWRDLNAAVRAWSESGAASGTGPDNKAPDKQAVDRALGCLRSLEEFYAFPGRSFMATLSGMVAEGDAAGAARLTARLSAALLSKSYHNHPGEWDGDEASLDNADRLPSALNGGPAETHRPYFEVLIVTPSSPAKWPHAAQELRRMRRRQDPFVYEPVFVGSFEDAALGAVLNPAIQAVVIYDGFHFASAHDVPLLHRFLETHIPPGTADLSGEAMTPALVRMLKNLRPELDLYLLSDRKVEEMAGRPDLAAVRRVFYEVEEPLEIHLSILKGINERFETPYFDNLKKYSQRPMGTFHALPVARGKSIFKSNWIRDMGEFYGLNLFLAESSATTGGLDSLLEPTGNIKDAQDKAARAFGADHAYFVTNGTSTSNKIVEQALLRPGDIVLVDRNCHKSHHYGMVLAGARPVYLEAYPMMEYSMYGGVPLRSIKKALLDLKAEGKLDRVRMLLLTNCTFDGHVYNVRRVMEECLAIKPDLIFLWDEAWFGFARFSPFFRQRTAMGAAALIKGGIAGGEYRMRLEEQRRELGDTLDPADARLLDRRLVPDPDKVRVRVYQTNSTHKSMSALRQGSMILVCDQDFHHVEESFHEAIFTHTSTSPNLQIIASLDVARRQMELEGYEMVMKATQLALSIRQQVNGHPLVSKYFRVLDLDEMVPAEFRETGMSSLTKTNWTEAIRSIWDDEFVIDPTRLTLVCGSAGFDGTAFKGLLAEKYDIQINKTSRNSILLQTNINNTRSDVAHLMKVLVDIARGIEERLSTGGDAEAEAFKARVASLMKDVPDMPDFSRFHDHFREDPDSATTEGDMRSAFYLAYDEAACEHVKLNSEEIDRRLKDGPELVSANFVIPYPPGFPIMVPGQVITAETIEFMRKLDVKEIHGYQASLGLKLLNPRALQAKAMLRSEAA